MATSVNNDPFNPKVQVISGGQTGVDRAALNAAMASGIEVSGWCPRGRRAVDGIIPAHYPLVETQSRNYAIRTALNVRDSDATLIVHLGTISGGTRLAREVAVKLVKPFSTFDICSDTGISGIRNWLELNQVTRLNIAGPREETEPGIYPSTFLILSRLFKTWPRKQGTEANVTFQNGSLIPGSRFRPAQE